MGPDSYYSSVNSFSCLIYLYVCAPLVVQLHLLSLIGSSHDNHSGHLFFFFFFLTMACAVVKTHWSFDSFQGLFSSCYAREEPWHLHRYFVSSSMVLRLS